MSRADEDRGYDVPRPPVPVPGCDGCQALSEIRTEAGERGDYSAVTEAVVRLRGHLAAAH